MQVEHTADCFGGARFKSPLSTEVVVPLRIIMVHNTVAQKQFCAANMASCPTRIPLSSTSIKPYYGITEQTENLLL